MIQQIIEKLYKAQPNLPSQQAHKKLWPNGRTFYTDQEIQNFIPNIAGVLLLLFEEKNEIHFVLMERQTYDGAHSGEISLPGGKVESKDKDLISTALRETEEEIGIPKENIFPIIPLSKIYIPPSNFWVQPFVGIYNKNPHFQIDSKEVKNLIIINLREFLSLKIIEHQITKKSNTLKVPAFFIQNQYIWGATAMILNEFKEIIQ